MIDIRTTDSSVQHLAVALATSEEHAEYQRGVSLQPAGTRTSWQSIDFR